MSTLLAKLYLGRLSRDRLNFQKTNDSRWNEFGFLKKAFVARHPELEIQLNSFLKEEKNKWRGNFSDSFKKHSFEVFVFVHVPVSEYIY